MNDDLIEKAKEVLNGYWSAN